MSQTTTFSKSVLIVDDDPDSALLMEWLLTRSGYEVRTASNGLRAIERIACGWRPSVIVLDMMMPVMDGPAFLSHRSAHPLLARTPVIVVSGTERVPPGNVQAFLRKPFDPDQLLAVIERLTSGTDRQD